MNFQRYKDIKKHIAINMDLYVDRMYPNVWNVYL